MRRRFFYGGPCDRLDSCCDLHRKRRYDPARAAVCCFFETSDYHFAAPVIDLLRTPRLDHILWAMNLATSLILKQSGLYRILLEAAKTCRETFIITPQLFEQWGTNV